MTPNRVLASGPSPTRRLVVRSEFFLQSLLRYPIASPCPHCGARAQTTTARKFGVMRIVRCADCGLYFSRPIYRSWLAPSFYDHLYWERSTITLPEAGELTQLMATDFGGTDKDARARLDKIRRHAGAARPALLEIGCSWGYFLHQARSAGFAATGIEIAAGRRDYGRRRLGLEIVDSFEALPSARRFDVVYCAHVLEHFTDLTRVFAQIAGVLAPQGVVFIEVPNFDPLQFGPRCFTVVGAVHPLGFDSAFFHANLPRHGLAVTGIFASWDDLPDRPVPRSPSDLLIVRAGRASTVPAAA